MSAILASPLAQHLNHASSSNALSTPGASRTKSSPSNSPQQGSPRSASPRAGSSGTLDVDTVLRASGGDLRKALEGLVNDRNNLLSQNGQLWKLIEKQRAQCAHLVADNERIRSDRDRANRSLMAAGLEPVNAKRIPNSSSVVGLELRPDLPQMRRHNSDRDEKIIASSLEVPKEGNSSAPSSPMDKPKILLPSPMAESKNIESKLRRESRMVFPPEVSSFMSLADSPRDHEHPIPAIYLPNASPGPVFTNPSPFGKQDSTTIPPPSSRPLAVMTEVVEEGPPRGPPPRSSSIKSPMQASFREGPAHESRPSEEMSRSSHDTRQSEDTSTPRPSTSTESRISQETNRPARTLPHLAPALLPHTRLSIPHSTVYPNAAGRDVLCFIVAVTVRPPNAQPVTWNVVKLFSAFIDLDTRVKAKSGKGRKDLKSMLAPLPDGKAWKDFAPSKVDQRKAALEAYLQSLLVAPLSDKSDLCSFLSTDPVQAKASVGRKEGYLTKKGKNFGGWKTRFFVLDGPIMEYYESRGGAHLGSISIAGAQIGRQNRPSDSSDDRNYRHAFLIIESVKKGTTNRHVLCADSDVERDSWIEILVRHVDAENNPQPPSQPQFPSHIAFPPNPQTQVQTRKRSDSRKSSKDFVVTAAQPIAMLGNGASGSKFAGAPSPSLINSMESQKQSQPTSSTSAPSFPSLSNSTPDQRQGQTVPTMTSSGSETLGDSPSAEPTPRPRRQSMMPVKSSHGSQPAHSAAYLSKLSQDGLSVPPGHEKDRDRKAKSGRFWPSFGKTAPEKASRPVFGVPLTESIAIASVANLPAIVFRCIEWLEAKHAEQEEGIYRLSGSSAVIKGLKDKFDVEGDVNLKAVDEHWDPHAVAGLLKTFLRDLPTSLLTRELHPRFLAVMDFIESSARVAELSRLVSELPPPNYALLRALTAHLILIVKNSSINKMTLRNIGIVFSPTLGIPAGIFSELVSHFGAIFDDEPMDIPEPSSGEEGTENENGLGVADDVGRKRNSMLYAQGGADTLLGLTGRSLDPPAEDSASETSAEADSAADGEDESEFHSAPSSENLSVPSAPTSSSVPSLPGIPTTSSGGNESYPSAAAVRKAKAAAKAAERGLSVETPRNGDETLRSPRKGSGGSSSGYGGLPASPRPPGTPNQTRSNCVYEWT